MATKVKSARFVAFGQHYHVCADCNVVFIAKTTDEPLSRSPELDGYDPIWCGCDGCSSTEDKLCKECYEVACADAMPDRYYDDYDVEFADPYGRSALRAEVGGSSGHCPSCKGKVGKTAKFCKNCGNKLNPRAYNCPTCGAKDVLTEADVQLGYQCDRCADRAEGNYYGGDY